MSERPKKKQRTDYPQLAFRIKKEDKEGIMSFIDDLQRMANSGLGPDDKRVKKNELMVDAIWLGLLQLKKKYRHLKKAKIAASTNETDQLDDSAKTEAS